MYRKIATSLLLSTVAISTQAAVALSQTQTGELIVLPYYSVKNNMATNLIVSNHSKTEGKLVQISYKESNNNQDVLIYNVMLKPNSNWAVGLSAIESNVINHEGEPSAVQFANDQQCGLFLPTQQQFLPFGYEETENSNLSLERAQEGHIEVYEIGSYDPNFIDEGEGDEQDVNFNICSDIEVALINNHDYLIPFITPPTGEISASANLVNVSEGTSYSYNGIAFHDFLDSENQVFDDLPLYTYDFNDSSTTAMINFHGQMIETQWATGAEAINALITSHDLTSDFSLEAGINAQTEVVIGFPGKSHMNSGTTATAPFTQTFQSDSGSCETAGISLFDRQGNGVSDTANIDLCWGTNVIKLSSSDPSELSDVLMSQHETMISPSSDSGRIMFSFDQTMQSMNGHELTGLPVLGFSIQRYTNANAAPGLLAQYGSLFNFSSVKKIQSL